MDRLKNRVIIVTGGAQGIGLAYCRGLASEGARVVVADIDQASAETAVQSLGEQGADALAVTTDVSNPEDTEHMAKATLERFGRNAIAPGLTVSMDEMPEVRSQLNQQRIQARALKRAEVPEDLVGAAVFLCSQDSDFMTRQTMVVDGGAQMG